MHAHPLGAGRAQRPPWGRMGINLSLSFFFFQGRPQGHSLALGGRGCGVLSGAGAAGLTWCSGQASGCQCTVLSLCPTDLVRQSCPYPPTRPQWLASYSPPPASLSPPLQCSDSWAGLSLSRLRLCPWGTLGCGGTCGSRAGDAPMRSWVLTRWSGARGWGGSCLQGDQYWGASLWGSGRGSLG